MADVLDFQSLYPAETEEQIAARWEAWANEGLTDDDVSRWTDVREGTWWWVCTRPQVREHAREYDVLFREVPASALPQWSWAPYLDDIGRSRGVDRLAATFADGVVRFLGLDGTKVPAGAVVGVEPVSPGAPAPSFVVTLEGTIALGSVALPVRAETAGEAGNAAAGAVTVPLTPLPDVTALVNDDPIVGGTDEESDAAYRQRIVTRYAGPAAANAAYYRQIALDTPGVGRVSVIAAATGAGTIAVIVSTALGQPAAAGVVAALQQKLDPTSAPGQGAGLGQVGAKITVSTAATLGIDVAATVEFETGYSMDGGGGTVPLRAPIVSALAAYISTVGSGDEVVLAKVSGRIAALQGVHDVGLVKLNGVAANVQVPSSPAQVPTLASTAALQQGTL